MEKSSGRIVAFLLVLLVLASHEGMMVPVEGRTCESPSHGFKGLCFSNRNCGLVCRNEGFTGGHCRGARRRCFCTKPC